MKRVLTLATVGALAAVAVVVPGASAANPTWTAMGSGMTGSVRALAVESGKVYAAGNFTAAGSSSAHSVAVWNGSSWAALGTGAGVSGGNAVIQAVAVAGDGTVYVGGSFTSIDGVSAMNVAKWNGSAWSALGQGLGIEPDFDDVKALAVNSAGDVYAGGYFTASGETSLSYIARWNGSAWVSVGSGVGSGVVKALAFGGDGTLYAGGGFQTAGGSPALRIAKWNGSAWSAMGSGLVDDVLAIVPVSASKVYVGGWLRASGETTLNRLAQWDGTQWTPVGATAMNVGGGISGGSKVVYSMVTNGQGGFFAGGIFTSAGALTTNNIVEWTGSEFKAVGGGVSGSGVLALAFQGSSGSLAAGGIFTTAGTTAVSNIASITMTTPASVRGAQISGSATVGSTLAANATVAGVPAATVSYTWQSAASAQGPWTNIPGGNKRTFKVTLPLQGKKIRVIVTANNGDSASDTSAAVTVAAVAKPGKVKSLTGKASKMVIVLAWKQGTESVQAPVTGYDVECTLGARSATAKVKASATSATVKVAVAGKWTCEITPTSAIGDGAVESVKVAVS